MRTSGGPVGPGGATLLLVSAVAGGLLAVHGWSTRHAGPPLGALSGAASTAPGGTSGSAGAAGASSPGSSTSTSPTGGAAGRSAKAGPALSSESFASYSYQVWPGAPSAAAKTAMTGLSISVHKTGSGISVTAGVSGQQGTARAYPGGARVYVVEASMGDEAGNADYNLGDDGVVITDAHGRIVQ
jgi:hypothetical protein